MKSTKMLYAALVALSMLALGCHLQAVASSDEVIKSRIDHIYNFHPDVDRYVDIDVNQGYVTIEGELKSSAIRDKAEDMVDGMEGVQDVHNLITVEYDT